jgi:hypothetical protein
MEVAAVARAHGSGSKGALESTHEDSRSSSATELPGLVGEEVGEGTRCLGKRVMGHLDRRFYSKRAAGVSG